MDARELKVGQLVATGHISARAALHLGPQPDGQGAVQGRPGRPVPQLLVRPFQLAGRPDYECIHMTAARAWLAEQTTGRPAPRHGPRRAHPTDPQAELGSYQPRGDDGAGLVRPAARRPDPRHSRPAPQADPRDAPAPLADRLFAAVYRSYVGFSARGEYRLHGRGGRARARQPALALQHRAGHARQPGDDADPNGPHRQVRVPVPGHRHGVGGGLDRVRIGRRGAQAVGEREVGNRPHRLPVGQDSRLRLDPEHLLCLRGRA